MTSGLNPEVEEHADYLSQLCVDFEQTMKDLIGAAVTRVTREENLDPLYVESLQHFSFRKNKCRNFSGREQVLEPIERYIRSKSTTTPFVLLGQSGSGKTSVMAKAATDCWKWINGEATTIYRYLFTKVLEY